MKMWTIPMAFLALTMSVSLANAAKGPGAHAKKNKQDVVNGEITKIDGATVTVQPREKKNAPEAAAAVALTATDATKVLIDGQKKAVSDLTVGEHVHVRLGSDHKTVIAIIEGKKKDRKQSKTPPARAGAVN